MDRSTAVTQPPPFHAVAIRHLDEGFDDHTIAAAPGIEEPQVPLVLRIADSKLANLMAIGET